MKKDILIKMVCLGLALVFVCFVSLFVSDFKENNPDDTTSQVFSDFSLSISKTDDLLELFLSTEETETINSLAKNLSEELKKAQQDYKLLNSSGQQSTLDTFLNHTGEYILQYAESFARGISVNEQRNKIEKLKKVTERFCEELSKIDSKDSSEKITEKIRESYVKVNSEVSNDNSALNTESSFEETENSGNPLADAKEITENTALQIAAKYINTENSEITRTKKDEIDTFVIANEFGTVNISVNGGYLISFSKNDAGEIKNFSHEQCIDKAKEFVLNYYSVSFAPRYFEGGEEDCFIVFTGKNGATMCNPDKIEITVSKVSGEILSFDASAFLLSYRNRTLRAPEYSEEEARKQLKKDLTVEQVNQVLIGTQSGEEMCYEFICKTEENAKILVYVNAHNLKTEEKKTVPQNKNGVFLK